MKPFIAMLLGLLAITQVYAEDKPFYMPAATLIPIVLTSTSEVSTWRVQKTDALTEGEAAFDERVVAELQRRDCRLSTHTKRSVEGARFYASTALLSCVDQNGVRRQVTLEGSLVGTNRMSGVSEASSGTKAFFLLTNSVNY